MYIHTMENYSTVKKSKVLINAATYTCFEDITLRVHQENSHTTVERAPGHICPQSTPCLGFHTPSNCQMLCVLASLSKDHLTNLVMDEANSPGQKVSPKRFQGDRKEGPAMLAPSKCHSCCKLQNQCEVLPQECLLQGRIDLEKKFSPAPAITPEGV